MNGAAPDRSGVTRSVGVVGSEAVVASAGVAGSIAVAGSAGVAGSVAVSASAGVAASAGVTLSAGVAGGALDAGCILCAACAGSPGASRAPAVSAVWGASAVWAASAAWGCRARSARSACAADVVVRSARPGEEAALTELAVRSKGHWGHDAAFLQRARAELTVRPEHLDRWIVRVAEREGGVVGVAAVDPQAAELELLFVEPGAIGTGVGRVLLQDALARAREGGLEHLLIESDPDAEPFYRSQGAQPCGTRVSSSTGRELPLLRISTRVRSSSA